MFKIKLLDFEFVVKFVQTLLQEMNDECIKILWKLFLIIGPNLDSISDSKLVMDCWFKRIEEFTDANKTKDPASISVRMLAQISELRKNEWISRHSNKPADYFEQKLSEFFTRNKSLGAFNLLDELFVKYSKFKI